MSLSYKQLVEALYCAYADFNMLISSEMEQLKELHLTAQQESIIVYIHRKKVTTANYIANTFSISKSVLLPALFNLEQLQMISKRSNPENNNENLLTLGKNGHKYMELRSRLNDLLIKKYYSKIKISDLSHLTDTLIQINLVILQDKQNNFESQ